MNVRMTGCIRVAKETVGDVEQPASLLPSLRKRPNKYFYTVAVDKDGKTLAIDEHSSGVRSSMAIPKTLRRSLS